MIYTSTQRFTKKLFFFFWIILLAFPFYVIAQNPGGVSGSVAWYKANSGVSLISGNIAAWSDSSTSANNATQVTTANQPGYAVNSFNFNQGAILSGTNYLTTPTNNLPSGNSSRSVFVVATSTNTQPGNSWLYGYGNNALTQCISVGKLGGGTSLYVSVFGTGTQSSANFWTTNVPKLATITYSNPTISYFDAGTPIGIGTQATWNTVLTANSGRIGTLANTANEQWRGNIAEVIMYPSVITGSDAIKIESYLATKYGIHKAGNYVNSSGTVVWDATANVLYDNDVFGIGQDDGSGLLQSQSNSVNTGSGDGTGQSGKGNIIISNPSSLANNGFLMIGHDLGLLAEAQVIVGGKPTERVQRTWKVQSAGNPGTVSLSYDITGLTYSAQSATDYVLLVDPTGLGNFDGGSVVRYSGAAITANKVSFNTVALPTGAVFTIQTMGVPALQATNIVFSGTTATSTTIGWTNGNGSSRAVFMYAGATGTALPIDLTTYVANTVFGTGTQIGVTGWYCVYNGTGSTVNVTGLSPLTTYQVMTVEYSGILGTQLYLSTISTGNPVGITMPNNVATLNNLAISQGTLTPVFATGTTSYTATVANTIASLTMTPTTTDSNATVTVNGTVVTSGNTSGAINLVAGPNVITTVVTAQDGITTQTYTTTVTKAAAAPIVTNFSPQTGPVGTTVTITGNNFGATIGENIVFFGATRATVTAVSATSLTVTVPAGATYQPISVLNGTTVLSGSSRNPFVTSFTPNKGRITIDDIMPKVDFAIGRFIQSVACGDFDGDGRPDLALTEGSGLNAIGIYRNTSVSGTINTSSFTDSGTFAVGSTIVIVKAADMDGDGKLDLLVTNSGGTKAVSVFRNTSSGIGNISFAARQNFVLSVITYGLEIGDIDGDGKPDIVTSSTDDSVSVLRNISSGVGNINFSPNLDFNAVGPCYGLALGDLDGDGKIDIVVSNVNAAEAISVFLNTSTNGTITFSPKIGFSTGSAASRVLIGDLDKDGKPDLVLSVDNSISFSVLKNTSAAIGNISFAPKIDLAADAGVNQIAIGDFDGDGMPDLAAGLQNAFFNTFRNTGSGGTISFTPKVSFVSNSFNNYIIADDLDGDGKSDLVIVNNNTLSIFRNNPLFAPTVQATNVVFSGTTTTGTTASWTNGNGSSRAVFMYAGATGTALPIDLTTYVANTVFGTGTQIGVTGWYCVYNGTGSTVNITGLTTGTHYQLMVVEQNGSAGDEMYQTAVSTGNPAGITAFSSVATLSNLTISAGTLTPVFATGTTTYTATVGNNVTNLTVTPTTTDSNATVTVNGTAVTSGSASGAIALAVGPNVITTVVTAQDGITIDTYTITVTKAAAVPIVTNFSPQTGPVGTTVSITGNNFGATIGENIVFFGATRATVTAASATSLTVTVPVGATYQPISVLNTTSVLLGSSGSPFVSTFTPNKGNITIDDFSPKVDFATASFAFGVTIGDFDGDAKPDIAILDYGANSLSILRNTSTSGSITGASFAAKIDFATGLNPQSIEIGDFDGDGKIDLAVTNFNSNSVSVFRNTSSGIGNISFATGINFANGVIPNAIVVSDFDGDGKSDFAVTNYNTNSIATFRNISSGIGNINFAAKVDFVTGNSAYGLSIGDLDGDGKIDVAVTATTDHSVNVLRNISTIGAINFSTLVSFPITGSGDSVVIGDFNNDNKPDLAVLNGGGINAISILNNTSSGIGNINFGSKVDFATAANISDLAIGDLDGDGKLDLAVSTNSSLVSTLRNTTSGSGGTIIFAPKVDFASNTNVMRLKTGDLDGDGKADIITTNPFSNTISVLRNNPLFGPTTQATNVVFTATTGTSTTASWTNGNGSSRAVFMYAGASGSPLPIDYIPYTANAAFGTGAQIGTSGWYCVYYGTGTTVNITGLNPAITYQVMVVERNGSATDELYLSTVSTGNPSGVTTLSNIATLSNLTISAGTLTPVFATGTTTYTATVGNNVTSLTVTPTTTDNNATVTVNGTAVTSGSASGAIALAVGPNVITTVVTAQDGTTIDTYTITVTKAAAPPIITNFSPQTGPVGTSVVITGANFGATTAENIVFFGATLATVTAASATSLTVTVSVGATFEPISVLNTTTALIGYSVLPFITTFTPNKARITIDDIEPRVNFATGAGANPFGVIIIDLDLDGKPDLVTVNSANTGSVSFFRNISTSGSITTGSFAAKIDLTVGSTPREIVAGDFDGDGKPDLALTSSVGSTVIVLKNTSSGIGNISFVNQTTLSAVAGTFGIVANDLDGDGRVDLAVTNTSTNLVSVFRNTSSGIGNFSFAAKSDFVVNSAPYILSIGDIDNDGKADLIIPHNSGGGSVSVLRNTSTNGTINFDPFTSFASGANSFVSAVGDLNKDGKADIAVANGGGSTVSVLKNISSGIGNVSFDPKVDLATIATANTVSLSDIDGDGNLDMVVASNNSILSFFHNTSLPGGAITFGNRVDFANNNNARGMAIGDLDGDGKNDIVTANNANNNISIFRNNPLFAPTIQATNVVFTATTGTGTTASWTNGNGSSRAVFMYAGASGSPLPVDLTVYTANTVFNTGTQIGTSGWYCVYNGTGTTVNITGLNPATIYQVMVVERNGSAGDEMYLSTVSTGNPAGVTTLNNVATLSNLTISQGTLTPVFATGTTIYTAQYLMRLQV